MIQGRGQSALEACDCARPAGRAGTIVMLGTDVDAHRLEVAAELGAHHTVNIQHEDAGKLVHSLARWLWRRPCSGLHRREPALKQSLELVRPNGRITKIGCGSQIA